MRAVGYNLVGVSLELFNKRKETVPATTVQAQRVVT
jgi:hypothetical protein